ncbi:hypothetical protein RAVI111496_03675 [Rahnella victoriana]
MSPSTTRNIWLHHLIIYAAAYLPKISATGIYLRLNFSGKLKTHCEMFLINILVRRDPDFPAALYGQGCSLWQGCQYHILRTIGSVYHSINKG